MRFRPAGLLCFAAAAAVASTACSTDATVPSSIAAPRAFAAWGRSEWSGQAFVQPTPQAPKPTERTYVVTIDPRRSQVLHFGPYTLELPGNAICSQDSGYGLALFDLDCKTEKGSVTITALVTSASTGIPRIDLLPEMRFSPKRVVTLSLFLGTAPMPTSSPRILYCPSTSATACIDEAVLDPTLATRVDAASNTVFRRIKHFSGYFVEW